ncbi:MAG: hypothetical protein Q8920_09995 [Bacillota bacterium]|nr:hypothetical protein [Bacillota bacterium]
MTSLQLMLKSLDRYTVLYWRSVAVSSLGIVAGFQGIPGKRAKVDTGFATLAGSRKIVCRCTEICIGRS